MDYIDRLSKVSHKNPAYSKRFSHDILTLLLKSSTCDKNIVVSPARLQAVMVLIANWAEVSMRNKILTKIGSGLLTLEDANILSSKRLVDLTIVDWLKDSTETDNLPTIEQQAILWIQNGLQVNESSLKKAAEDFAVSLNHVDFNNPELKSVMDKAISDATHGLIKQLDLQITQDTKAIFADILYFKAKWDNTFDENDTRNQVFYGMREKQNVPMMKITETLAYYENEIVQVVKLPYTCIAKEKTSFSMRIYLPKPKHDITDILQSPLVCNLQYTEVKLSLPRFSVESSINMKQLIENLGLSFIFSSQDIIPECVKNLQIQQVIQQTKVSIDENGTEAAAVTSVDCILGCCPMEKARPKIMMVNRPFMFEITEDASDTILFAGVINNL